MQSMKDYGVVRELQCGYYRLSVAIFGRTSRRIDERSLGESHPDIFHEQLEAKVNILIMRKHHQCIKLRLQL